MGAVPPRAAEGREIRGRDAQSSARAPIGEVPLRRECEAGEQRRACPARCTRVPLRCSGNWDRPEGVNRILTGAAACRCRQDARQVMAFPGLFSCSPRTIRLLVGLDAHDHSGRASALGYRDGLRHVHLVIQLRAQHIKSARASRSIARASRCRVSGRLRSNCPCQLVQIAK